MFSIFLINWINCSVVCLFFSSACSTRVVVVRRQIQLESRSYTGYPRQMLPQGCGGRPRTHARPAAAGLGPSAPETDPPERSHTHFRASASDIIRCEVTDMAMPRSAAAQSSRDGRSRATAGHVAHLLGQRPQGHESAPRGRTEATAQRRGEQSDGRARCAVGRWGQRKGRRLTGDWGRRCLQMSGKCLDPRFQPSVHRLASSYYCRVPFLRGFMSSQWNLSLTGGLVKRNRCSEGEHSYL